MKDMCYRVLYGREFVALLLPQTESQVIDDTENEGVPVDPVEPDEKLLSSSTRLCQTEKLITPPSPVLPQSTFIPQGELSINTHTIDDDNDYEIKPSITQWLT